MSINNKGVCEISMEYINKNNIDDIFNPPIFSSRIENKIIENIFEEKNKKLKSRILNELTKFINSKNLDTVNIGKPRIFFVPKTNLTFRKASWFDIIDIFKYTSLVFLLSEVIERNRLGKEFGIVHSYRIHRIENDMEFDKNYNFSSFRQKSNDISKEYTGCYKIITDISNFYDRISIHQMENILREIGCDDNTVTFLNSVLLHFSNRNSFGIPVGCDASRILAEASLINVDKSLRKHGINYVRFVDDFRIFSKTKSEAYNSIYLLSKFLDREGLFLNACKTRIEKIQLDSKELESNERTEISEHNNDNEPIVHVIRGYGTKVSFSFRKITDASYLDNLDVSDIIRKIREESAINPEKDIRNLVRYFLYIRQNLEIVYFIIRERLSSIPYFVDAIIKEKDELSEENRNIIKEMIREEVKLEDTPSPYILPIIRLLSSEYFLDSNYCLSYFRKMQSQVNPVLYREVLILLGKIIPRVELRSMCQDNFSALPFEVQRALYVVVRDSKNIFKGEKEALLKDMKNTSQDIFIKYL